MHNLSTIFRRVLTRLASRETPETLTLPAELWADLPPYHAPRPRS